MRRLAAQTRGDAYSSLRDYQTIVEGKTLRFAPTGGTLELKWRAAVEAGATDYVGFGGFLRSDSSTVVELLVATREREAVGVFEVSPDWCRIGVAVEASGASRVIATLRSSSPVAVEAWGLNVGRIELPDSVTKVSLASLSQIHLLPETFYLDHEGADLAARGAKPSAGQTIYLKKCSYCTRLLPLDPTRPGVLSFHKHNAKRTGHQNECRACKTWRINRHFNPIRTTDQLHESSVITRERQLFLRDPEILQAIKQRTGAGLKSQIWKRFNRQCFNCRNPLALKEVQLDHTRPLAYLWPIDEHATCLCATCNNAKKEKFPVDFYAPEKLQELATITGLSLGQLRKRELNDTELQRMLNDLPRFANKWSSRTFAATARKIRERRPDLDLYEVLRAQNSRSYERLMERLAERPVIVTDS